MNIIWALLGVYLEIIKTAFKFVLGAALIGFTIFAICLFFYMIL